MTTDFIVDQMRKKRTTQSKDRIFGLVGPFIVIVFIMRRCRKNAPDVKMIIIDELVREGLRSF